MKPYNHDPFTNSLKQVVLPGDTVVVVTGGRGSSIHTYKGTYLGCRPYRRYGRDSVQTVVEVEHARHVWMNEHGKPCRWKSGVKGQKILVKRKVSLITNRIFALA